MSVHAIHNKEINRLSKVGDTIAQQLCMEDRNKLPEAIKTKLSPIKLIYARYNFPVHNCFICYYLARESAYSLCNNLLLQARSAFPPIFTIKRHNFVSCCSLCTQALCYFVPHTLNVGRC